MTTMRLVALAAVIAAFVAFPAHAQTVTTFEAASEGCAGGGDVCGSFPFVPGDATYTHAALPDGTAETTATAEGVLPACAATRCAQDQLRFHGEAIARTWTDVQTAAGASEVTVRADYLVEQISASAEPLLGFADAASSITIAITAQDASPCADGASLSGEQTEVLPPGTEAAPSSLLTTLRCSSGTLRAATWRVEFTARASATADGGASEAAADGRLSAVHVSTV